MKNLIEEIKMHEYITKISLIQAKEFEQGSIQEQLNFKKNLLKQKTEKLSEVEGQIRILRNKGSSSVFSEFTKIANSLQEKKDEQKQIRARLQKVQKDTFAIKQEINSQEDVMLRKNQELEWKSKQLINQEKQK